MKLTTEQIQIYIDKAIKEVLDGAEYKYRFGQALWNSLPKEVTDEIYQTELDFFYWTDSNKVYDVVYKHLVKDE